jgi:hypothetical protein
MRIAYESKVQFLMEYTDFTTVFLSFDILAVFNSYIYAVMKMCFYNIARYAYTNILTFSKDS